jgi:hypothetical protein
MSNLFGLNECIDDEFRWQLTRGVKPKVTVDANCSLNYRPYQQLIDPTADLVATPLWHYPLPWITLL